MLTDWYCTWQFGVSIAIASILLTSGVNANEVSQAQNLSLPAGADTAIDPMANITKVTELSDVQPNERAFQILRSLLQRYGVVGGYPDQTFHGDRPLTRYEFAAALYTALQQIDFSTYATPAELAALKQLREEFNQELTLLRHRVERLESDIQPFSTTTKLSGEVLVAVIGVSDAEQPNDEDDSTDSNLTLSSRVRLNFDTSFTGEDRLRTRLQARSVPRIDRAAGTQMARLAFQGTSENDMELSRVEYRFPVGESLEIYLEALGASLNDMTDTLNPVLSGSSSGSISRFGQRNPIYRQGGGAGLGLNYEFNDSVSLSLAYLSDDASDPDEGFGEAAYGALAQLTFELSEAFSFGLTYVHSYNSVDTRVGSDRANDPFNEDSESIISNSAGLQTALELDDNITLSGWLGLTRATAKDLPNNPSANIFNWAVTLAFSDLGGEGNTLGMVIGQPPKVTSNDFSVAGQSYQDPNSTLHLEALYRMQINDSITITSGVMVLFNPEHDRRNDTLYVGTVRTTFSF